MFMGEFRHTLDPKNRVIIPAKFRTELGDRFVLTAGLDGCLYIYTYEAFGEVADALKEMKTNKKTRAVRRHFMQNAAECEVDSQGRIVIPANLKKLADIDKEAVFIGDITKIQVWSSTRLDSMDGDDEVESIEDIIEEVTEEYDLSI